MAEPSSIGHRLKVLWNPGFWFITVLLVLISVPHYGETLQHPGVFLDLTESLGLERHAFERILFLAPIVWAGFIFGQRGALLTSLAALVLMLPRCIFLSESPHDALLETAAVFILGNVVAILFSSLRKERERRTQLEDAEKQLQAQVEVIRENEKRLAALNRTATILSQSLDLKDVLNRAIDVVIEVMQVEASWILLLEKNAGELSIAAYRGISDDFVESADKIKLGQGFNGQVAITGEPLYVENASEDPRLTRKAWKENKIHSLLIAPLKSKGQVVGTLCAVMRCHRVFSRDEVDLLVAIGSQIGVAVENARLYEQEREMTAQLRASEERYRQLFENAYDAIVLHDLQGRSIAVNRAASRLTGYSMEELDKLTAADLMSEGSIRIVMQMQENLLNGEAPGSVSEVTLVRKDRSEAHVQLSTSLVSRGGRPVAFQYIAHDVTEEKRMRENLRYYLQQATIAQEEERKRIARELHDETIQALVVLSRQLDELASANEGLSETAKNRVENLLDQTNAIMQGVRRLSQDLRPPTLDRLGLLPALEWLASNMTKVSGMKVDVRVHGQERRLPTEVELLLFRMAQEALSNVWRHAQASHAELIAEIEENKVRITVKDNGKGFDLPGAVGDLARYGKLGLAGMQERARLLGGTLKIESATGEGTTVTIEASV